MTDTGPDWKKRNRQVLGLDDFTEADLAAIRAAEPPPEAAENDEWRAFDATLAEVRAQFADLPSEALQSIIEEAIAAAREEKP
jgi:hypothetical protein